MIKRDYVSYLSLRNRVKSASFGDIMFLLFDYLTFDILLNKSTCNVSYVCSICTSGKKQTTSWD